MDEKILKIAEEVIKIPREECLQHYKELPEIGAFYFWNPIRGGLSVIIDKDGTKLVATSAVSFEKHVDVFKSGKRN